MISGTLDAQWQEFVPIEQVPRVLAYISTLWKELVNQFPATHHFRIREEKLTLSLNDYLDDFQRKKTNGITGRFVPEIWNLQRLPTGEISRKSRSDILYFFSAAGVPELVIEFKKLDCNSAKRKLYCTEGMRRFVDGTYAKNQTIGVMCGLVQGGCSIAVPRLIKHLLKPEVAQRLSMVADTSGSYITSPSRTAVGSFDFDTLHDRQIETQVSRIAVVHFFVEFI
jgi:hypothetical protein